MKYRFGLLAWLALCIPAWAENPPCQKIVDAELQANRGSAPVVMASVAGSDMPFLLSIASQQSYMFQGMQDDNGLSSKYLRRKSWSVDDSARKPELYLDHHVEVDDLAIGGFRFPVTNFLVLPDSMADGTHQIGAIGLGLLYHYNVDFDFAGRKMSLFTRDLCTPDPVWSGPDAGALPFRTDPQGRPVAKVKVNGEDVLTWVETGRDRTTMSLEAAKELFHVNEMSLVRDGNYYEFPVKTLQLGGITMADTKIYLVPDTQGGFPVGSAVKWVKLSVGMDVLRQYRLYMAYKAQTFYLRPAAAH